MHGRRERGFSVHRVTSKDGAVETQRWGAGGCRRQCHKMKPAVKERAIGKEQRYLLSVQWASSALRLGGWGGWEMPVSSGLRGFIHLSSNGSPFGARSTVI